MKISQSQETAIYSMDLKELNLRSLVIHNVKVKFIASEEYVNELHKHLVIKHNRNNTTNANHNAISRAYLKLTSCCEFPSFFCHAFLVELIV